MRTIRIHDFGEHVDYDPEHRFAARAEVEGHLIRALGPTAKAADAKLRRQIKRAIPKLEALLARKSRMP